MKTRDERIDILKTIGLFGIVIAHSRGIPRVVDYLRNFEVVLMVLLSGLLYSRNRPIQSVSEYGLYVKKRAIRLVLPTWVFLTCFFIILKLMSVLMHVPFPYNGKTLLDSYLMINGIGYVWIMLVYMLIAIGLPCLIWFVTNDTISNRIKIGSLVAMYLCYEFVRYLLVSLEQKNIGVYYFKNTLPYLIIYTLIAGLGFSLRKIKRRKIVQVGLLCLGLHGVLAIMCYIFSGALPVMSALKFPPTFVYLTYALGVSLILIGGLSENKRCNSLSPFWSFVGKNCQWIYLNHIYFIFIWNQFIDAEIWWAMALFCFLGAIVFTWLQVRIVNCFFSNKENCICNLIRVLLG